MSSQSSGWLKKIVAIACLVGSGLAIYNVNSDIAPLQQQAEELACGAEGCVRLIGLARSPFKQTFTFQVQENSTRSIVVECTRAALLFGSYSCQRAS